MSELPVISLRMLSLRNGKDRPEIWVGFRGLVYDVAGSFHWKGGLHYEHWAGQDLTHELGEAPHDDDVFAGLPIVGRLEG